MKQKKLSAEALEAFEKDRDLEGYAKLIFAGAFLCTWIVSGSFWYALLLTAFGGGIVACVIVFAAVGFAGLLRSIFTHRT